MSTGPMDKDILEKPCRVADVEALLSKFGDVFSTVKPGSLILLRISKSCGESFTLEKTTESFNVRLGDTGNEDLVLDIDKPVFEKIKTATDLGETLEEALKSGQASVDLKADQLTLFMKGYLGAAQKLGLA